MGACNRVGAGDALLAFGMASTATSRNRETEGRQRNRQRGADYVCPLWGASADTGFSRWGFSRWGSPAGASRFSRAGFKCRLLFHVTPFAANVSFAFGDIKNLIKLSAVARCGAFVISAAVYGIELWRSPGNGPRSFIPGVVAMSGIVPAAMSFPLPFKTGSKMPRGDVRTILGLSVS